MREIPVEYVREHKDLTHGMKFRKLGSSDLVVPEICLGTMTWGMQNTEEEAHQQMDLALDEFGINFLDAAEMYPVPSQPETQGLTETYIGNWMKKRKNRKDIILATKVCGYGNNFIRKDGEITRVRKKDMIEAIDNSLKRLQTDYVDLYQVHWPDRYVPIFGSDGYEPEKERDGIPFLEQLEALQELVQSGKVRYVGLSNETPWGVMQYCKYAKEMGLPKVVSLQNSYSMLVRADYEQSGLLEICAPHNENIGLLAYSPLAGGVLTGKYQNVHYPPEGSRLTLFKGFMERYKNSLSRKAVSRYGIKCKDWDINLSQMSLAWVYSREFVASTIIGATNLDQLRENILALNVPITPDMDAHIAETYVTYRDPTKVKMKAPAK
eukprot:CAMPEP_0117759050 /NCGR_PEP_ID=MMETSP0947-20121206/15774_1 /TAXON_ID=44440 /ORGANISM="Chattonella subsalsa, Strain CCMP2191" /LENGTH=379 /DNA_ID=CAMNT_0005579417 /DNA_START=181 /DNA_END=1320 /DNA_ORIENTATION=-